MKGYLYPQLSRGLRSVRPTSVFVSGSLGLSAMLAVGTALFASAAINTKLNSGSEEGFTDRALLSANATRGTEETLRCDGPAKVARIGVYPGIATAAADRKASHYLAWKSPVAGTMKIPRDKKKYLPDFPISPMSPVRSRLAMSMPPQCRVRRATTSDAPAILALIRAAFSPIESRGERPWQRPSGAACAKSSSITGGLQKVEQTAPLRHSAAAWASGF